MVVLEGEKLWLGEIGRGHKRRLDLGDPPGHGQDVLVVKAQLKYLVLGRRQDRRIGREEFGTVPV